MKKVLYDQILPAKETSKILLHSFCAPYSREVISAISSKKGI